MAVVEYSHKELCQLLGKRIRAEELCRNLDMMGAPVESMEGEQIFCDITPNRIDLLSVEGVARALSDFMGFRKPREYRVKKSGIVLKVDESVKGVRPFVAAAAVKGITIDDATIRSLMQVQEKLHATHGRNRKKVAIGIHNLDPLKSPFTYKAVHPNEISFVPLDMAESMNLEQILERHPKGGEYAHIVKSHSRYPIIVDASGNVLSFPPIINGELTRVSEGTTNIFIDITGTSFEAVNDALNVICALFADRGGELHSVSVGGKAMPDMRRKRMGLSPRDVNKLIGFSITPKQMSLLLRRMGHTATGASELSVGVPPYRVDVMHWVDLAEDVAIAYGYDKLKPTLPQLPTIGKLAQHSTAEALGDTMIGLGFNQVMTYTLSNKELNYSSMLLEDKGEATDMVNPLTSDFTIFRTHVLPSLLRIIGSNSHEAMPQKLYEIGKCMKNGKGELHIACAVARAKATFSGIKSVFEAMALDAGWEYTFKEKEHKSFIRGRCLSVRINGKEMGIFGELHPQVLNNFRIEEPTVALEVVL